MLRLQGDRLLCPVNQARGSCCFNASPELSQPRVLIYYRFPLGRVPMWQPACAMRHFWQSDLFPSRRRDRGHAHG